MSPLIKIRRVQRSVLVNAWVPWKTNVAKPLLFYIYELKQMCTPPFIMQFFRVITERGIMREIYFIEGCLQYLLNYF